MIQEATERQRITMLRQLLKLSQTEFSRKIGISQGALSQIESGRSRLSMETLKNLSKAFNVNCNWIVSGKGDIFIKQEKTDGKNSNKRKGIPLVDVNARAGYIKGYKNINYINTLDTYDIPGFKNGGSYRMFEIEGESMVPTLFPSEIVIAKQKEIKNLESDKLSVILTKKALIAKRAKRSAESKDKVKVISDNPEFSNFNISLQDIVETWEIQGKISKKLLQNYVFDFHRLTTLEQDIKNLQSKVSILLNKQAPGSQQV
ncbi:MAG: XRE family transcriptional regulator [Candidatus Cyclobacteriaceae bacterium M2_1C_046]